MDRVNGADHVDIGGGKRGFRSENLSVGVVGTEVTAAWLNAIQEEILKVVEAAGLVASQADWTQLYQALQTMIALGGATADIPVIDMRSSPPGAPAAGDRYIIAPGASGTWAGQSGKIAIRLGAAWLFATPPSGLLANYWSGTRFVAMRYNGADWAEWMASEAAAGPVELASVAEAVAGTDTGRAVHPAGLTEAKRKLDFVSNTGTANAIVLTPFPALTQYRIGTIVIGAVTTTNTGPVTLNVSGLGPKDLTAADNKALAGGELVPLSNFIAIYNGITFCLFGSFASEAAAGIIELATPAEVVTGTDTKRAVTPATLTGALQRGTVIRFATPGSYNWVVPDGVTRVLAKVWGGGGGGGAGFPNGASSQPGGGGAGGGYAERYCSVTPGQTIPITVGSGGAAGVSGTVSSFGSYCASNGGGNGGAATSSAIGIGSAGGGTGVGTDSLTIQGNAGQNGIALTNGILGGCGGGTHMSSNTFNPAGNGRINGSFPGGGGSGGTSDGAGGVGGGGLVILETM